MKTRKHFKAASIAVMMMGIIHVAATPFIIPMFSAISGMQLLAFIYMYVATGLAVIFTGLVQYIIVKQNEFAKNDLRLLKISVIMITCLGIGAAATMWDNPFAYLSLIITIYELYLLSVEIRYYLTERLGNSEKH